MIRIAISVNKCDSGGQKSLVMAYLRNFDHHRIQFDLIVDEDSNSIPYEEVKKLGGGLYVIPPYQHIVSHMKTLRRLFKENNYDALYALNNTMNLFPLCVAYYSGIKVRVSESLTMASPLERKKTLMKNVLKRFSHLYCNYYMANGRDCGIYQFGRKAYKQGKIAIFLSPVDAKKNTFDPVLREETRKMYGWTEKVVYGHIARFEKQKNPLFLIDVMNEIAKKQEESHFVVIGAGSMEQQMKDRIDCYGLNSKMSWLGRREDILQFYNSFDAFLLPSIYEGLPVVGVESQATGLPVFFSEEVTREAAVAELGHFISLKKSAAEWADIIIKETAKAMPIRRGRVDDLVKAGFDAVSESERLTRFFENAVEEQNSKNN
jgi:glycosyltransferase involved in cell wall biosynthesis